MHKNNLSGNIFRQIKIGIELPYRNGPGGYIEGCGMNEGDRGVGGFSGVRGFAEVLLRRD